MATGIAFAVAVLAVVGRHLPTPLRTFLLTLATVDDMSAVLVIAVACTSGINFTALALAAVGLAVFGYLQNSPGGRWPGCARWSRRGCCSCRWPRSSGR